MTNHHDPSANMGKEMMETHKPRIALTFSGDGHSGGPNVSHRRIMDSLLKEKYEFIAIHVPRIRELIKVTGMRTLVRQIKDSDSDIVHLGGLQLSGFFVMWACRIAKVKRTVVAVHGSSIEAICIPWFQREIYKMAEDYTLRGASVYYGVSRYILQSPRIQKYRSKCFGCIYNMHPADDFVKSGLSFREEFSIGQDEIVISSIARIVKEKGYGYLIKAIELLKDRSKLRFVIVGQGAYLSNMQATVAKLGLRNKVIFTGFRADILRILEDTDVFVLPSLHETLSISLIEAGFMGIPSVASDVGGIPEVVADNVSGILVQPADAKAIAAAITILLEDSELRKQMGREAKRITLEKFDPAAIIKQIDCLYEELLEKIT
jgi:L-malate glycosyltransferase